MAQERRRSSLLTPLRKASCDSHGADAGADLDEEMEKVFAGPERFDVAHFAASPGSSGSRRSFGEKDYSLHRKKSYQHIHMPLKSIHSRSMRKIIASPESDSVLDSGSGNEGNESRKTSQAGTESDIGISPPPYSPPAIDDVVNRLDLFSNGSPDGEKDDHMLSSESEPQVSERAGSYTESPLYGSPTDILRRVQFEIGEIAEKPEEGTEDEDTLTKDPPPEEAQTKEEEKKQKRKHSKRHHHHHRFRKYSLQEDPQLRKRLGSDFGLPGKRVPMDDESSLQEHDLDDLASHRFEDPRALRRYKIQPKISSSSVIHIGRRDGTDALTSVLHASKKTFDHSPHEVFVQLDELIGDGEDREWRETARWIKYEEDVLEGADRWGRPHVASLSFHSLINLRRCIETGVILLDLEEKDLPGIAYRAVEQMVVEELITPEEKTVIMRALLLRHRHVNEHEKFRFGMKRTTSSYTSLQNLSEDKGKPKIVPSVVSMDHAGDTKLSNNHVGGKSENHAVDIKEELTYTSSTEELKKSHKESILRRIPLGAEATLVLVGCVDFLEQPTIAFVRLAEGTYLPTVTEVKLPTRFIFILLGPKLIGIDYHEIGRSIATLMSNGQFHTIAYKATERKDLLSAINEFLDDSIVLPPGDWERQNLLPFTDLKAKSDMIRKRKNTALIEDEAKQALLSEEMREDKRPPGDDPLRRTRRPFGGLINDIKRRFPHYVTDMKDGLNMQCLAAAIFMYFAALSGAITFGGLMSDKTNNLIGISETLISTSLAGILFALLAGQPLIIIGSTGPLLLFDESLYGLCESNEIDFLTLRVYIGLWLGIIAAFVAFFEGSVLVKLFTRFTEEIFAALISILYIVESFMKLVNVFKKHAVLPNYCDDCNQTIWDDNNLNNSYLENSTMLPLAISLSDNTTGFQTEASNASFFGLRNLFFHKEIINQPNTALFCLILALGTFFIAYYLRQFRNSKFLGRSIRRALGDFGVPIAIITMVAIDYFVPEVYTEKLKVPSGLSPSNAEVRGWIISFSNITQFWHPLAAIVPALLIYVLLFMETHICELIIDKKDRKLKKGSGFHLDIVLVCVLNMGCGIIGAPWMCAATVRSIAHTAALTVMSRTHAPGDKPHIVEVKEQRISALLVSILVGISVSMSQLLRMVPISVLFGVFLYMGVSSTNGIQLFERIQLIFMPVKHHPQVPYVRRVHTSKMHLFTFIQLGCLAILWVVKSTAASLAFPFFLVLMVPLRTQLRFLFSPSELRALDSEEADDEDDEPDFYAEAPLPG